MPAQLVPTLNIQQSMPVAAPSDQGFLGIAGPGAIPHRLASDFLFSSRCVNPVEVRRAAQRG
jgi:hypothetical protein